MARNIFGLGKWGTTGWLNGDEPSGEKERRREKTKGKDEWMTKGKTSQKGVRRTAQTNTEERNNDAAN